MTFFVPVQQFLRFHEVLVNRHSRHASTSLSHGPAAMVASPRNDLIGRTVSAESEIGYSGLQATSI